MTFKDLPQKDKDQLIEYLSEKLGYAKDLVLSEVKFKNYEVIKSDDKWVLSDEDEQLLDGWLSYNGM